MTAGTGFSNDVKQIAEFSKALSHPVRVYILKKLSGMDSCCYSGDLVEELPVVRSTLSEHLKVLKSAGLIQGEINPPYIKYCLNRKNWEKAQELFNYFFNENQSENTSVCETKAILLNRSV
jgi:DNA-binding transcriptional ArsR family regulator